MEDLYPSGPTGVPENLTAATASYKQKAWLAMAGLGLFVLLYLCLSGWFVWQAWRLIGIVLHGHTGFGPMLAGAGSAFLAVFMLKALFFVNHGGKVDDIEVTAQEEPALFAFLHRLADDAGAPRPHRVFLSARVNAAVFYDLSILNLLFPSRKNLDIGLALVNVLTLGELKAVLAHEFGHFAQRSMAVGRWVYIAQQIAGHLIAKRDKLDGFLNSLSRVDFRIAWVGWLLSLIVWSIRSLLEAAFRLVLLAQRALSREMEMQADLVAVSLTGSDALIHALHRIPAADDAWERALSFADGEFRAGRLVKDLFALQTRVIAHMRVVLNDKDYGKEPVVPAHAPESHRLFAGELARPPKMWATHPLNHEREANAKRIYIPTPGDSRSAWTLFNDAQALRERVSAHMVRHADAKPAYAELAVSLMALDEQFKCEYLNRAYRGVYLGRSSVRLANNVHELYDLAIAASVEALATLYPESLTKQLERLRDLQKEKGMLESLHSGVMTATDGEIRYRGKSLRRNDLPAAIAEVQAECMALERTLHAHDRHCRSVHRVIAARLGNGWEAYLLGVAAILHYADHSEANLRDAQGVLGNVLAIETAAGKVNRAGWARIVAAADALHTVMYDIHQQRNDVVPDTLLLARMKVESWPDMLGKFDLPPASQVDLNGWIRVIDSWVNSLAGALAALRQAALGQLLQSEAQVARQFREGAAVTAAPAASKIPSTYPTLPPGTERKRQTKLGWWARFQIADGPVAGAARLLVAGSILGVVLGFGGNAGEVNLTIYNGLAVPITARVSGKEVSLRPASHETLTLALEETYHIETRTADGRVIEVVDPATGGAVQHFVYNVAAASPMVEWTAVYGNQREIAPRLLGAPHWFSTAADDVFEAPPRTLSTKGGGGRRMVLSGSADQGPEVELNMLHNDAERRALILARARWDDSNTKYVLHWLAAARNYPEFGQIITARLHDKADDVGTLRIEQNMASIDRPGVCARHTALAAKSPTNSGLQYVAARCLADSEAQNNAMLEGASRWPQSGWFALGAGYAETSRGNWRAALGLLEQARTSIPSMEDSVSLEMARIYRLLGETVPVTLQRSSDALRFYTSLEKGDDQEEGPAKALSELERGDIEQALRHAGTKQFGDRLLRLAAGSVDASPEVVRRALALPVDRGLDFETAWVMLALSGREHGDASAYLPALAQMDQGHKASMLNFRQALLNGMPPTKAENLLMGLPPLELGEAYCMGAIMLGKAAPPNWREKARHLLFASERPYLGG